MATKTPIKKKNKVNLQKDQGPDPEQKEFLMWFQKKFQLKSEEEMRQKIQELGEQGLQEAYAAFKQEKEQTQMNIMKKGGMLKHLDKLIQLKCGGKMKKKKEDGGKMDNPTASTKPKLFTKKTEKTEQKRDIKKYALIKK